MKSTASAAFGVAAGLATGSWSNAATSDLVRTFCRPEWFLLEIARLEAARLHTTEPPMSKQSALHKIGLLTGIPLPPRPAAWRRTPL